MRSRVINPNTSAAMTETIAKAAREAAGADTTIEAVTSASGPVSIDGYYDGAMCLPGLLKEIRRAEEEGADAHVIACFDDTLSRSIQALELKYGFDRRAHVRAADISVLALEDQGSDARARIDAEVARALVEDRAEAIVLGCAGMAKLARDLSAEHACPVIDGVGAAVKLAEMLIALRLNLAARESGVGSQGTVLHSPLRGP